MPGISAEKDSVCNSSAGQRRGFERPFLGFFPALAVLALLVKALSGTTFVDDGSPKAKVVRAKADIQYIADQVKLFQVDQGQNPEAMEDMTTRPKYAKSWPEGGYLERTPKDPWGEEYVLRSSTYDGQSFDIISYGRDNQPGGEGFDADLSYRERPSATERR